MCIYIIYVCVCVCVCDRAINNYIAIAMHDVASLAAYSLAS